MKIKVLSILCVLLALGCKKEQKKDDNANHKELDIIEKIALAHGYENWNKVNEIAFTFNVDRDSTHFERSWVWEPKTNNVSFTSTNETLSYNRKAMDSIAYKTNSGFINDRYWLLAPFNLIWDRDNYTFDHERDSKAPISKKPMQKLTIVYGNEGGYTPGDAYDFFFGDDYIIREWVFRKENQSEPSMVTTWENYSDVQGFKFVRDHKKAEGNFNLYIDGISVKMN